MANEVVSQVRYGEAFWRAHHDGWKRSELNQRQYCETHGIPLKAFGNWRAKFKAEPQPSGRKLLYRRGGFVTPEVTGMRQQLWVRRGPVRSDATGPAAG